MDYCELHLRYPGFKARAVTLSYDDGAGADRKMVEILNRYGMKCTFNLNPCSMKQDANYVQPHELAELYSGHEIAAHGFTHPHLHDLDLGGVAYQIVKCREALEAASGRLVQGFAYPFGLVVKGRVSKEAKARFRQFTYITNRGDIVTHLPFRLFGYRHVKKQQKIGKRGKYSSVDAHRPENYRAELIEACEQKREEFVYDG